MMKLTNVLSLIVLVQRDNTNPKFHSVRIGGIRSTRYKNPSQCSAKDYDDIPSVLGGSRLSK
jgi:hypothetical protein